MAKQETLHWKVTVAKETTEAAYEGPTSDAFRGVYVLAHGASGNLDTRNLVREAGLLRALGWGVARFNFFYRAAGRSYPDKMPQLVGCYAAVVASLTERVGVDLQAGEGAGTLPKRTSRRPALLLGGHSMGGRVATMMVAEGFACNGLLLFSYPLHPPGKFEQLRAEHLPRIRVPVLCFNGTRDDFMRRDLMEALLSTLQPTRDRAGWTHHWVEHADHSLAVRKKDGRSNHEVDTEIQAAVSDWSREVL